MFFKKFLRSIWEFNRHKIWFLIKCYNLNVKYLDCLSFWNRFLSWKYSIFLLFIGQMVNVKVFFYKHTLNIVKWVNENWDKCLLFEHKTDFNLFKLNVQMCLVNIYTKNNSSSVFYPEVIIRQFLQMGHFNLHWVIFKRIVFFTWR